jgi:hypothetical protein
MLSLLLHLLLVTILYHKIIKSTVKAIIMVGTPSNEVDPVLAQLVEALKQLSGGEKKYNLDSTIPKLTPTNFTYWLSLYVSVLQDKGLGECVEPVPEGVTIEGSSKVTNQAAIDLHTDPKRQQLAANIFIRACSQEVLAYTTIDDRTSARLMMKSITKELRPKGEARYLKLSEQLSTLKYDGLELLASFKLKVDAIFTELEATDVKPSFQLMRMIHLKTSMGRAFAETIGNFDSSTTSNDAWDRLERKDEALRRLAPGGAVLTNPPPINTNPGILAFMATASLTCTNCNKSGHVIDDCYRLHPEKAPASWRKAGRGGRGGRGRGSRGRGTPSGGAPGPPGRAQGLAAIDPEDQAQVFLAAIDSNSKEKSSSWTLDSGATHHLTNKPSALHRYTPYDKPITV